MPDKRSRGSSAGHGMAGAASVARQRLSHTVRNAQFDPRKMSGRGRIVFALITGLAFLLIAYLVVRGSSIETAPDAAKPPASPATQSGSKVADSKEAPGKEDLNTEDGSEDQLNNRAYTQRANVEIDVTTRTVSVTSAFAGTEIVLFGAVEDVVAESRAGSPTGEDSLDIVLAVKGAPQPLTIRRKSNVGGLWLNTDALAIDNVPSFYALSTTRELHEIATPKVLAAHGIGFQEVIPPNPGAEKGMTENQLASYREALLRLKQREGLFFERIGGVSFTGQTLFRSTVRLPANVPVGPLVAEVYVFSGGDFLTKVATRVELKRAGLEKILHELAFENPLLYGIMAVFLAVVSGLIASAVFQRAKR